MPSGDKLPSLFQEPGLRFKLEKYRIWLRIKEVFGYAISLPLPLYLATLTNTTTLTVATTWATST